MSTDCYDANPSMQWLCNIGLTMVRETQTQSFQQSMFPDNAVPGQALTEHTEYPVEATTTPPPTSAAAQTLPSNVDYPGEYDFEIYLGQPTSTAAKSVSWTYSPSLKKLFVDKDKACPVMFKTSSEPPPGSYIRAMPIFKKPEYIQEQVRRCPNHAGLPSEPSFQHIITCSEPSAMYNEDSSTNRLSVVMDYKMPQIGTEHTTYLLTFKCFLSCVGGLNRRQIQTVFTLENRYVWLFGISSQKSNSFSFPSAFAFGSIAILYTGTTDCNKVPYLPG